MAQLTVVPARDSPKFTTVSQLLYFIRAVYPSSKNFVYLVYLYEVNLYIRRFHSKDNKKMQFSLQDTLVSNIDHLLTFIRNPPSSELFWNTSSSPRVLNALLKNVEVISSTNKSSDFIVTLRANIAKKAIAQKNTLDRFNLILDDPEKGLPIKFSELQSIDPDLTLKAAINKIIEQNNKEDISRQIDNNIEILKLQTISLANNENKTAEISSFYHLLKNILVREAEIPSALSSEILIVEAKKLKLEIDKIKKVILPLIKNGTPEHLLKAILLYTQIIHNVQKRFPGETKIYDVIDVYLNEKLNQNEKITYQAFNWGYQEKKPGFFILVEKQMNLYDNVTKTVGKLNSIKDNYLVFFELIEKISDPDLKQQLRVKTDNYFTIQLALETNSNKDKLVDGFRTFENESKAIIKAYKETNQLNSEQLTLLYKLLHTIAKAIPDFIATRENVNNFFFKHTREGKHIIEAEKHIHSAAPAA